MITENFRNELLVRKYSIVSFLMSLFLVIGLIASLILTILLINGQVSLSNPEEFWYFLLTICVTFIFAFVRFFYIKRNFQVSFIITLAVSTFVILLNAYTAGTLNPVTYILIFLMLLSSSIVLSVKISIIYSAVVSIIIIIIARLQEIGLISFEFTNERIFINSIVYLLLIGIGAYIVKIGYEQIEYSYQRAYDYAKDLEELNKDLDEKVRFRTKQLQESLENQADSIHSAAIVGSLTKPMIHDLATPISSLLGAHGILKKEIKDEKTREIVEMSGEAVNQVVRIVENARNLMNNKNLIVEFSPYEVISTAVLVSKHELEKDTIKVIIDVNPRIKLKGVATIFERMVINIIINAVEELRNCRGKRVIRISGKNEWKHFVLKIRDSGRGIPKELIDKIFDTDFTLKSEKNLGFGLAFVKNSIEKNFNGDIQVESEVGKFTEFILRFDRNFNDGKSAKSKTNKEISPKRWAR